MRPDQSPGAILRPAELVFGPTDGGLSPTSSADVLIYNPSTANLTFAAVLSSELTFSGVTVAPLSATVRPDRPVRMTVQPRFLLERLGRVNLQFSDGNVRPIGVKLSPAPAPANAALEGGVRAAGACTPSKLVPKFVTLGQGSKIAAGAPSAVVAEVMDDCGQALSEGSAQVYFSNGDAPIALVGTTDGRWHGTWQVRGYTAEPVSARLAAEDPARGLRGEANTSTELLSSNSPPVLTSENVVSAAQAALSQPIAPGGMISIYGEFLAESQTAAASIPLPQRLGNAEVVIAGQRMPLLFASQGQINAVVPSGVETNTSHLVLIRRGTTRSQPVRVSVAPAQPGAFTTDGRRVIAVVSRGAQQFLASPSQPVRAGDVLVLYCSGLGEVTPAVEAGTAAPASPVARLSGEIRVRLGNTNIPVAFAGMTPGFAGLYQLNVAIPAGVPTGADVALVIERPDPNNPASFQRSPESYLSVQ